MSEDQGVGCCDFELLKVFHVTRHHVGRLIRCFSAEQLFVANRNGSTCILPHVANSQNILR